MPYFLATGRVQAAIAEIAARQHGVITTAQLRAAGMSASRVTDWTLANRLHRRYRGVYAVGHAGLSNEGEWMAAVLACGEGAVLSHRSAAMLWRMLEPRPGMVHVSVASQGGRARRDGLRLHRLSTLLPGETTRERNVPVTKPARTLADLKRAAPERVYRAALRKAEFLRLPLGAHSEADGTRSGLEADFLAFCRRHRLPLPEVNAKVGPFTVDFLWRSERVVVETDAYRTHGGPVAFEEDRERDLWLAAHGLMAVRVTGDRLARDAPGAATELRAVLRERRRGR